MSREKRIASSGRQTEKPRKFLFLSLFILLSVSVPQCRDISSLWKRPGGKARPPRLIQVNISEPAERGKEILKNIEQGNFWRALYLSRVWSQEPTELREVLDAVKTWEEPKSRGNELIEKYKAKPAESVLKFSKAYGRAVDGDWKGALDLLKRVKGLPKELRIYRDYYIARGLMQTGSKEKARKYFNRMAGNKSYRALWPSVWMNLAILAIDEGNLVKVGEYLEYIFLKSRGADWQEGRIKISLARHYMNQGLYDRALQQLSIHPQGIISVGDRKEVGEILSKSLSGILVQRISGYPAPSPIVYLVTEIKMEKKLKRNLIKYIHLLIRKGGIEPYGEPLNTYAFLLERVGSDSDWRELFSYPQTGVGEKGLEAPRFHYASYLLKSGREREAADTLTTIAEGSGPFADDSRWKLANLYFTRGDRVKALTYLKGLAFAFGEEAYQEAATELMIPTLLRLGNGREAVNAATTELIGSNGELIDESGVRTYYSKLLGTKNGYSSHVLFRLTDYPNEDLFKPEVGDREGGTVLFANETPEYLAGLGMTTLLADYVRSEEELWQLKSEPVSSEERSEVKRAWIDHLNLLLILSVEEFESYRKAALLAEGYIRENNAGDPTIRRAFLELAFPTPYKELVDSASRATGVRPSLIYAVMKQESGFNPNAKSPAGAVGLMQIMPDTASTLLHPGEKSDLRDPEVNIKLGARMLARLINMMDGDKVSAVAAYNAGPSPVLRWRNEYNRDPDIFMDTIPYAETRTFTRRVTTYESIYEKLLDSEG